MKKILEILRDMNDNQLIELVNEMYSNPIAEDSPLRKICIEGFGEDKDDVMYMLSVLPKYLLYAIAERFVVDSPHVTVKLIDVK